MEMEAKTNKKMGFERWKNAIPHVPGFVLVAFVVAAALRLTWNNANVDSPENILLLKEEDGASKNGTFGAGCNLNSGRWVYDDVSYPPYKEGECSFMEDGFACEKYGKKSLKYRNWRWQPHHCDIPRFDGGAFLEKLRGKKLMYVGDSLGRNQWRSMLCLIESYLPPLSNKEVKKIGDLSTFHSIEYNATIGFYWSPFLVESLWRTVRLKSIEKNGRHWMDADILVFDSYAWWHRQPMTLLWGSFNDPNAIYKVVNMKVRVFEIVLSTWADWLEMHINPNKTKIFFMSPSPLRIGTTVWWTDSSCYNVTAPSTDETYWANGVDRRMMSIAKSTIERLGERGVKVEYVNVTQLSGYREDARPSIYRRFWGALANSKNIDPRNYSDCMHWCLPGVPDLWNQIIYAYLMIN